MRIEQMFANKRFAFAEGLEMAVGNLSALLKGGIL